MFEAGTRVRVKTAPDKIGTITGKNRERAGRLRLEVNFGDYREYIRDTSLEAVDEHSDIFDLFRLGRYASAQTLRSAIAHTRLTGRLADVIYSMDASNTDFLAYQFKPVLNFLDSPSKGILIADEVGLGKTIEAGLIWTELRARFDAKKLLVLCPAVLREKWQEELGKRFGVRAEIYSADEFLKLLKRSGAGDVDSFAAIVSMQGARPPRHWQEDEGKVRGSAALAQYLSNADPSQPLVDCLVIDEAHYLRNPNTQFHELARIFRDVVDHLLLLSATPIHLRNDDLFHLLSLIDKENFRDIYSFNKVLKANAPLIKLADKLRLAPLSQTEFKNEVQLCLGNDLLSGNRQLRHLLTKPPNDSELAEPESREHLADRIERVNLLARTVSRTRKRDVQTNRVVREPTAPNIQMTKAERAFYDEVTERVRNYCIQGDLTEGFILTIPQRQMCSSIPAAFRAWRRAGQVEADPSEAYETGFATETRKTSSKSTPLIDELAQAVSKIATFNELKAGDSKYRTLLEQLRGYWKDYPDKKIVLFSYYRETLKYLYERLTEDGIAPILLFGGMRESKQEIIERFRTDPKAKILLASEVASEGVDLQFSSFLINYDLPWNPMRVEQRIGRIDRIGQTEDRILILNFFYADSLDERIYVRLFERLKIFIEAFGDIEAVLGEKIQELTNFLLSHRLTPEQEENRIEQARIVIARTAREQKKLEDEASQLAAHGDYVLNQVKAARQMRRYIDPRTLWHYVRDALLKDYPGTEFIHVSDDPLTAEIGLSDQARIELKDFVDRERAQAGTRLFNSSQGKRMKCVFSSNVSFSNPAYEVLHQHHPVVRFVRERVRTDAFHPLIAARVAPVDACGLRAGTYLITTEMWSTSGARTQEKLVFAGVSVSTGKELSDTDAEILINAASQRGLDWPASRSAIQPDKITELYESLLDKLEDRFEEYAADMERENNDRIDYLVKTLTDKVTYQIAQQRELISRLQLEGKTRTIPAREGKIRKLEEHMKIQKGLFERRRTINTDKRSVVSVAIFVGTVD